jgi:hypothetical protein
MLDSQKPWIQPVLEESLRQVRAPGELCTRIHFPTEHRRSPSIHTAWLAWTSAAAVLALGAMLSLHTVARADPPSPIRIWIKASTGVDLGATCNFCHSGDSYSSGSVIVKSAQVTVI